MAEAVRPKKTKPKSSGTSKGKSQRQIGSQRKVTEPAALGTSTCELNTEFTDISLNPSIEQHSSAQKLTDLKPLTDKNDTNEKDVLLDTAESAKISSTTENTEPKPLSQVFTIKTDESSTPIQQTQWNCKNLDTESATMLSLYPSLSSLSVEKQFLDDLFSDTSRVSQIAVVAEGSTTKPSAPAILPLVDQEGSSSCLQLVALSETKQTPERLYPEVPRTSQMVQPLTNQELVFWLQNVESHASEFQTFVHHEDHKLHKLLLNYLSCRKQLTQAQIELQTVMLDCKTAQNQLWTFKDEQLTLQGVCADQVNVYGYHRFQSVVLNEAEVSRLQNLFTVKADVLHLTLALQSFTCVLSRLQVDSYLYHLLSTNPVTRSVAVHETGPGLQGVRKSYTGCLEQLKKSISVLFSFTRRMLEDTVFHSDIHMWLQKLVSVLQHVGSNEDQLFILNHLLCCPAGIRNWGVSFLQIKVLKNHFMQALAILMSPVRNRADLMCYMKPSDEQSSSIDSQPVSSNWLLVDEGGEEDDDPETSWLLLSEEDLIALISQFPFDEFFKQLLGLSSQADYQPDATTNQKMMEKIALASSLIELLAVGLQTYNRSCYRQFLKRIGHLIRLTLCYVSDHWAQYICHRTTTQEGSFSTANLQVEFDHLFLRAVLHVLKVKRLGVWLFMSEMPYGTLSSTMLWKIFYMMQCFETESLEKLDFNLCAKSCIQNRQEISHQERFKDWLAELNSSDGICLLTAFAHMAQSKRTDTDPVFVETIVMEIYKVSHDRATQDETFSKVGRELLAGIATTHPFTISILLKMVRETIDKVGMVPLYLFKELPLHLWCPNPDEVAVIRSWLLDYELFAVHCKLACVILEGLNWGFQPNGCLALQATLHNEAAMLILEAYQKHLTDKPNDGIISGGMKQISYLANVIRLGPNTETSFNQWAWDLVLQLKLHISERNLQVAWYPLPSSCVINVPELTDSAIMHPVFKAVKGGIPIGCFLALGMSTIGHSLEKFCSEGVLLFKTLVQSHCCKAALQVLDNILPLAYHCHLFLIKNEEFLNCIQLLLQLIGGTPQGVTQQVTLKFAQHVTGTSNNENLKLLKSMIQVHIFESFKPNRIGPVAVLEFWLQLFIEMNHWHRDKTVLYLLDHLCSAAFFYQQEECLQKILYCHHKNALGYHGKKGTLSTLMGWIVAGNISPSFIEGNALSDEVWFAWTVLNTESMFEEDSQLRHCIERELLLNPAITPDQALKKAQVQLKLHVVPSLQRLMIYRWAQQALVTPADHPLLPLIWQKFLHLYLHRPGPEFGLKAEGCIGKRYFHSAAHISLLKELKQRLSVVCDFHHAAGKALKVPSPAADTQTEMGVIPEPPETSQELHIELVRLFSAFALWMEDENLQKQELFLPSLPMQYNPHCLAKIMQDQQGLWIEYMDMNRVQHELKEVSTSWTKFRRTPSSSKRSSNSNDHISPHSAREPILDNMKQLEIPQQALLLVPMKAPVPEIPTDILSDVNKSASLIQEDLTKLQHYARLAAIRKTQQIALDNDLLKVLPQLYTLCEKQLSMQLECKGKGGQSCQGAAHMNIKYTGMHKLEGVQNQIQTLKSDIKQLKEDVLKPVSQDLAKAATHTDNFIMKLVSAYKLNPLPAMQKVGIAVFYQIVFLFNEDAERHPPTCHVFSTCLEALGQVFIKDTQTECRHMLKLILQNRRLCNFLIPYFTPNSSPSELVAMYKEVVEQFNTDHCDVIFMLLSRFDLPQWLSDTRPTFTDRSSLIEIIHFALTACGMEPKPEFFMSFKLLCKHWAYLLVHQFPDHYNDFLRLFTQSSSNQVLSVECWRTSLQVLGCYSGNIKKASSSILTSSQQVDETIEWLSNYFSKLRLLKSEFRSFGLLSKWKPYIEEVKVFWAYLVNYLIDMELNNCSNEPVGSARLVKVIQDLYSKIAKLFRPWILVLDTKDASNPRCSPWLESDSTSAVGLITLYTQLTEIMHIKFKDHLMPEQKGVLWLHLMHYCKNCTSPKMPEYLLYTYHTEYIKLPWKDLHPDEELMNEVFNVEKRSPKSCFLFMGEVLCEVNWLSVLRDAMSEQPCANSQRMVVYLLYLIVYLAKENHLISKPNSPLLSLLGESTSLPWHLVDYTSYQYITTYVNRHYPASLVLGQDGSSQQVMKLLKRAAGFDSNLVKCHYRDMTLKCQAFIHQMVQFLISLDQNAEISVASLEAEMESLLECIIHFSPFETDPQQRHMAICSLFVEILTLLNRENPSTAEVLGSKLYCWVGKMAQKAILLPLLTASCKCLASVRQMVCITEACILSYFTDGGSRDEFSDWGPILVSLQVPEINAEEFLKESMALGSYLTLYVYVLQKLNMEQTLCNEMKILRLLNDWISHVLPSGPGDEAKIILWWHKAMHLLQVQLDQDILSERNSLLLSVIGFQNHLSQLGEERLNAGILGVFGLGWRSSLSNKFRIVARSVSAFLLVQVPSESKVRIQPGKELELTPAAQQAVALLENMSSNKQYLEHSQILSQVCQFIKYPGHCLRDVNPLLSLLINSLYPDLRYLDTMR